MKLSEISIQRPVLATMMNLLLILFGVIGLLRLPVRELPDIEPPIINVQTIYPGASAAVMETQVTEPLEDALTSVEGIKQMTSESREQLSSITIEFNLAEDVDVVAQDVRDRISRVRGRLPEDIEEPIVSKQDADANPSIWVALYSERFSTLELTTIGEKLFKDRLQTVPGVSSVILGGSKRFAIRIRLDSDKMAAHRVTVLDVERALDEQSVELPSGRVESWQRELSIETRGQMKSPEEFNDLVILQQGDELVRLRDIGYADVGVEDERSVARYNGKPAVGIGVIKQSKANIIDVATGIKKELERIKPLIPEGITFSIPYDESIFIEESIKEVWLTLGIAFALVIFVIFVFLHNVRSTLIPSLAIPVSIVGTFGVLYFFGFSINIVTMLAFVLAIGLVVDDAIIVLENIHRHIEEGMPPFQAAYKGMNEIGFAIIATTVSLVAVFLPLAFQTSDTGRLFIEFAVAISFSVIISAFVALSLSPMMCARILKAHDDGPNKRGLLIYFEEWLLRRRRGYVKMLRMVFKYSYVVVFLCVLAMAGTVYFYNHLDKEFLPEEDKGRLFCIALSPQGSTSEYTNRMVRKMEEIISSTPEVEGFFSAVALARGGPGQASQGLSFIRLKEHRERHVRDIVNGPTGIGGQFFMNIEGAFVIPIIPKAIGGGFSQPFQLILQHQDLNELNRISEEFSQKLRKEGFLMNVRSTFELNKPELRIHINRDRAAVLGVSVQDISKVLQILFGGLDLSRVNLGGDEYDVIVQLERESRLSPSDLERIYVNSRDGKLVQLINVIDYETGGGPSSINHFNRLRNSSIEGSPVNIPLGTAVEKTEALLKQLNEKGLRYEWAGEAADLKETGHEMLFIMLLAILIIYMVLASQFESLSDPFVILFTLPVSFFGALLTLWGVAHLDKMIVAAAPGSWLSTLPRVPSMGINLFSQIGIILLIGIVTKNGILLVDFANQEMRKGKSAIRAMMGAGKMRFRPILMTAFSTIAGILPIAIGFGAGAESRRPLGVAAVGGIALGTFLTFFVVPAVYVLINRKRNKKFEKAKTMSSQAVVSVLLLCVLTAAGCKTIVGADYVRPQVAMPDNWSVSEDDQWKVAKPSDHIDRGEWWTVFNDEQLNDLQMTALAYNHDIKSAVASVEKARALARIERAEFYPQASSSSSFERSRTTENSFNSSFASANSFLSNEYTLPLDLSYEIDLWGRVKRGFEAGHADAEATLAEYHSIRLILSTDIAINYFLLRELDKEIEIIDETIKLRQYAVNVVNERMQGGVTSELDFNRAKTELAKAKSERVDVVRRRQELQNALAVLCGQLPGEFEIEPDLTEPEVPRVPIILPSDLLERRPDIARAERLVAAANARIGVAEAAFYPRLTLSASGGLKSVEFGNLFDWESHYWSFGPGIDVPVFTGGRGTANLEASKAEYGKTVEDYRQIVLKAIEEVETSMNNLKLRKEQAATQKEVLTSSRQTAELSISRYKEGLVTFLEVIDAERSRLDAELQATQIVAQRLIAAVQLIKAIGGSWDGSVHD